MSSCMTDKQKVLALVWWEVLPYFVGCKTVSVPWLKYVPFVSDFSLNNSLSEFRSLKEKLLALLVDWSSGFLRLSTIVRDIYCWNDSKPLWICLNLSRIYFAGKKFNTGRFSQEENDQLRKNWEKLTKVSLLCLQPWLYRELA